MLNNNNALNIDITKIIDDKYVWEQLFWTYEDPAMECFSPCTRNMIPKYGTRIWNNLLALDFCYKNLNQISVIRS